MRKSSESFSWVNGPDKRSSRYRFYSCKPTSQPFDFGKIGGVQGETTETVVTARKERGRKELSGDLVQSSGDNVYLTSDASSCKMKLYVLRQDVTTDTKKASAMCFGANVFNALTFTEQAESEINVEGICGSLKESIFIDKIMEMTEKESVTIEEARECVGEDQEQSDTTLRRSSRARKRANLD